MNEREARDALAGIGAAQAQVAAATTCPPWRHAAFGAIAAMLVGGQALPTPLGLALFAIGLAGAVTLMKRDRARTGMFVNGYRRGRTRPIAFLLVLVLWGLMAIEIYWRFHAGATLAKIGVAAMAFVLATLGSVWWQRVYVRELTRGGA